MGQIATLYKTGTTNLLDINNPQIPTSRHHPQTNPSLSNSPTTPTTPPATTSHPPTATS